MFDDKGNDTGSEWKDAGKGSFKITRDEDSTKQRILIRDLLGRLSLNCYFYKEMKFDKFMKKDKAVGLRFMAPSGKGEVKSLLVKMKPEDVDKTLELLKAAVQAIQ